MPRKKKEAVITAFKGFEPDFKCKDFQYEVGKEYETKGEINCCNNGFHACKVPLDVFKYYAPVNSAATNTGNRSAATNTGNWSAATNTGDQSAATNTGDRSAATNTGNWSAATNTGNWSAATNTGHRSKAEVEKENSAAFAFGYQARARAKDGWIIIVDWRLDENQDRYIHNIYSAKVGRKILNKKIESNVWYWFEDGKLQSEG